MRVRNQKEEFRISTLIKAEAGMVSKQDSAIITIARNINISRISNLISLDYTTLR